MTEEKYRVCKLALLTVFVGGVLFIGWRLAEIGRQISENGHYAPLTAGNGQDLPQVVDTRTGLVHPVYRRELIDH